MNGRAILVFIAVVTLQLLLAGTDVFSKIALNNGVSIYVFALYRNALATIFITPFAVFFERQTRPRMEPMIIAMISLLCLIDPVWGQNFYLEGLKYTTATYVSAISNIIPAVTFVVGCLLSIEKVRLRSVGSQAKVGGTLVDAAGAILMTKLTGPLVWGPLRDGPHNVIFSIVIMMGCCFHAFFSLVRAEMLLEVYPAELSLAAWTGFIGTLELLAIALIFDYNNSAAWALSWDANLLAILYTGVMGSGIAYLIQVLVTKERGPIFVTAFSPLCMLFVALFGHFILKETVFLGSVVGAIIITVGLYLIMWGKIKDQQSPINVQIFNIEASSLAENNRVSA